jgi:SAM-dependent MidA family methyltransferase
MSANDIRAHEAPLGDRLRERIRRFGPISFYEWMQAALYDETEGYYCRPDRARWGRTGDYRTAPETSPLFAATFARCFADLYADMGRPSAWTIVEAGAGSGHFARAVLESFARRDSRLFCATRYVIDEISSASRREIGARLSAFAEQVDFASLNDLAEPIIGIIFSNELLDAFPVHRLIYRADCWREFHVGLGGEEEFVWFEGDLTDQSLTGYLETWNANFSEGQIFEVNSDAEAWVRRAAGKLKRGFLISVDYGAPRAALFSAAERGRGTIRSFQRHQFVNNLLASPGEQDLTTTVDWIQVKAAAEGAGLQTRRFARLDEFLMQAGLLGELEQICAEVDNVEALRLRTSARELILPDGMAAAFQVLIQQKH